VSGDSPTGSTASSTHPFNTTIERHKTTTLSIASDRPDANAADKPQEIEEVNTSTKNARLPPKSPRFRLAATNASASKPWNSLTVCAQGKGDTSSLMDMEEMAENSADSKESSFFMKSPPRSIRYLERSKSPSSSKYQELCDDKIDSPGDSADDYDESERFPNTARAPNSKEKVGSPLIVKCSKTAKKSSPKNKLEWQLTQKKINGLDKTYRSPLSLRRQQKGNNLLATKKSFDSNFCVDDLAKRSTLKSNEVEFWTRSGDDASDDASNDARDDEGIGSRETMETTPKSFCPPEIPKCFTVSANHALLNPPFALQAVQQPSRASLQLQIPISPSSGQHSVQSSTNPVVLPPSSKDSPRKHSNRKYFTRAPLEETKQGPSHSVDHLPPSPTIQHMGVDLNKAIERAKGPPPQTMSTPKVEQTGYCFAKENQTDAKFSAGSSKGSSVFSDEAQPSTVDTRASSTGTPSDPISSQAPETKETTKEGAVLDDSVEYLDKTEPGLSLTSTHSLQGEAIALRSSCSDDQSVVASNKDNNFTCPTPASSTVVSPTPIHSAGKQVGLSRAARLRNMKTQSPLVSRHQQQANSLLKQNLNDASTVIQEEKQSSVGSNGSERSCLSNEELSNIASRALGLADVLHGQQNGKLESSSLLLKMKQRILKKENVPGDDDAEDHSQSKPKLEKEGSSKKRKGASSNEGIADLGPMKNTTNTKVTKVRLKEEDTTQTSKVDDASNVPVNTIITAVTTRKFKEEPVQVCRADTESNTPADVYSHFSMRGPNSRSRRLIRKVNLHKQHVSEDSQSIVTSSGQHETKSHLVTKRIQSEEGTSNFSGSNSEKRSENEMLAQENSEIGSSVSVSETTCNQPKLNSTKATTRVLSPSFPARDSLITSIQQQKAVADIPAATKPQTAIADLKQRRVARANALVAKYRKITAKSEGSLTEEKMDPMKKEILISAQISDEGLEPDNEDGVEVQISNSLAGDSDEVHALNMISSVSSGATTTSKNMNINKRTNMDSDKELPDDILSRRMRRRQHPAFAARSHIKTKRKTTTHTKKQEANEGANMLCVNQSIEEEAETRTKEPLSEKTTNDDSDDMPKTTTITSIFGDKKGIALTYWKYTQVKEGKFIFLSRLRRE